MSSSSRYISIRPDNVSPDATISFKQGFPVLSFTIQSQAGMLDPRSIRINGALTVKKDLTAGGFVFTDDADAKQMTMDNRLGIFGVWDQLIIRHNKSKQICEHIRHYNRYLSTYLGLTSSKQDLMGHLNESCLIQPNEELMFNTVVANGTIAGATAVPKEFSCHLPSGFIMSGNMINLMDNAFGGIQIEIHLSPDSNCIFARDGVSQQPDANYLLSNLSLSCEIQSVPANQMASMSAQSEGAMEYNSITSLYTSINTSNAQLQYTLGLRNLQSCFVTMSPASHINNLNNNGLATIYPSQKDDNLVSFKRVQWLRGGAKYPVDFDIVPNTMTSGNVSIATTGSQSSFSVSDPQLTKQFVQAVIPEYMLDRTSIAVANQNRSYLTNPAGVTPYQKVRDGGPLFGLGMRYSQFNKGQDFSTEQWGLSLESDLTTDNPIGIFMYFKHKATLVYNSTGVQIIQ
tara:strand:- start:544 stop:1917 length:1374 start_codon:yes stop_codon:yes gene_type:complete